MSGVDPGLRAALDDLAVLRRLFELHTESDGRCTHCVEWCDCVEKDEWALVADCPHGSVEWPCATVRAVRDL